MKLVKEMRINFASAKNIVRIARDAVVLIFAHPVEVVWIVSASFKASSVPRPKSLALCTKHLITSVSLVNENLAIRARFGVGLQKSDGRDGIRIAHMEWIVAISLDFPAMRASVLVTSGTLPSGRDESVAVVMSAAMNEFVSVFVFVSVVMVARSVWSIAYQLNFGVYQIGLECDEALDLIGNVVDESVMSDGSLSCRKHSLFLCEENVLLVPSEWSLKKCLGESEVHKLRMSELGVAEHALRNSDVFATKERLVAGAAGGLGTGMKRA